MNEMLRQKQNTSFKSIGILPSYLNVCFAPSQLALRFVENHGHPEVLKRLFQKLNFLTEKLLTRTFPKAPTL